MDRTLYYEIISMETEKEVDDFINNHPNVIVTYWEWRERLLLINRVYNELAESTKKNDEILESYNVNNLSDFDIYRINTNLSKLGVVENQDIHNKIETLNKYYY